MTRSIRVVGDIAVIPLTRGYEATIDLTDLDRVGGMRWRADISPYTAYAVTTIGRNPRRQISLHRTILAAPEGLYVDHVDGDGLNNRRLNLRLATPSQNSMNRKSRIGKSGFKGVCWRKDTAKWHAKIKFEGKYIHLGFFETPEQAYSAYCKAAINLHGEFARLS